MNTPNCLALLWFPKPHSFSTKEKETVPWALRIRRILFPVTLLTWAIPCESRRITPICDGVRPFFANLQMFSSTWNPNQLTMHKQIPSEYKHSLPWYRSRRGRIQLRSIIRKRLKLVPYILRRNLQPSWRSSLVGQSWGRNTLTIAQKTQKTIVSDTWIRKQTNKVR